MLVQIIEYIHFLFGKIVFCWYFSYFLWICRISSQITLIDRKIINRWNTLILLVVICHVEHFHISSRSEWVFIFIRIVNCWWIYNELCISESWFVINNAALAVLKWLAKSVLKALFFALLTKIRTHRSKCIKPLCLFNLFLNLLRDRSSQNENQIFIQIIVNTKCLSSMIYIRLWGY